MATNRGTGAGGANTNVNGLSFEDKTSTGSDHPLIKTKKYSYHKVSEDIKLFYKTHFTKFLNFTTGKNIKKESSIPNIPQPDEVFLNEKNKTVYILEKKNQNIEGSVDNKLALAPYYIWLYERIFEIIGFNYKVKYAFLLNEETKKLNGPKSKLLYNEHLGIPVWYESDNYREAILKWVNS